MSYWGLVFEETRSYWYNRQASLNELRLAPWLAGANGRLIDVSIRRPSALVELSLFPACDTISSFLILLAGGGRLAAVSSGRLAMR